MNELAKYEGRVGDIETSTLTKGLYDIVARAFVAAGYKSDGVQIGAILELLAVDIKTRYRLLELPEIAKAVENGTRFVYGDYAGISVATINKWLQCYVNAGEHQTYLENKVKTLKPLLTETSTKTTEEIDRIMVEGIIRCFEDYKNENFKNMGVLDYGTPKADYLLLKGILRPTKDERDELKAFAHERLLEAAQDKKMSYSRNDRTDAQRLIDRLIRNGDHDAEVISMAKNIMMVQWFEKLIEEKTDIKDVLK